MLKLRYYPKNGLKNCYVDFTTIDEKLFLKEIKRLIENKIDYEIISI